MLEKNDFVCHATYRVSQKSNPLRNIAFNFVKSQLISKIIPLLERVLYLQQKSCNGSHHTLDMLLHYLGKCIGSKFQQIKNTVQTKCVDFTFTHFKGSCLLAYYSLTCQVLVLVKYF